MKRYAMAVALLAALFIASAVHAADPPTPIVWDGGDGNWNNANWQTNQTPSAVLGRVNGWRETDGVVLNPEIMIAGDGVVGNTDVLYNAEVFGDWSLRSDLGAVHQRGGITISNAATLELQSSVTIDGKWTEIDARGITVTGAGSVLSRTQTDPTLNGGAFVFGSWQNDPGEVIDIKVLDFASISNQGQSWFGAYDDSEIDLVVTLEIGKGASYVNNGALRGGVVLGNTLGVGFEGEINFIWNLDPNTGFLDDSIYRINMTGSGGSLDVGKEGIYFQENGVSTQRTFKQLWDGPKGILQSYSASKAGHAFIHPSGGLLSFPHTSDAFLDHFSATPSILTLPSQTVVGAAGPHERLVNIAEATASGANPGDINGDFLVDAGDVGIMFAAWSTGPTPGMYVADGDINAQAPADDLIDAADFGVLAATFTGDPGPAAPGTAAGEYDPATGQIIVSVDGVNNWYVEFVGAAAMTGDAPSGLPNNGGLATDNDFRIGESAFAVFSFTDLDLGNVAQAGLPDDGRLQIFWNAGFGGTLFSAPLVFVGGVIPEPTTLALAALGLCGVLATRRRRV